MKLYEIKEILKATVLTGEHHLDKGISGGGGADLMEDVLAAAADGAALLTGLATEKMLRTARITGVGAIVLVRGKKPDDKVLEVGTGSGFLTACLSRLAGNVHSMDIQADFVEAARQHLGRLEVDNVSLENADVLAIDLPKKYDVIVVTGSLPQYDDRFQRALAPGGRLVLVVGSSPVMEAMLVTKAGDHCAREVLFETDIPALTNAQLPESFVF